jgi:hypothetical protein
VIYVVYASSATRTMGEAEMLELLERSRQHNTAKGITGILLNKAGNFLQVIEGNESEVLPLYNKICQDSRHTNVRKLLQRSLSERQFGDWSMGFHQLQPQDKAIPGYSSFLDQPVLPTAKVDTHGVYNLLLAFRQLAA